MPQAVYEGALRYFRRHPTAALFGFAGTRMDERQTEFLVPHLAPDLLFLRNRSDQPAVRVVPYSSGGFTLPFEFDRWRGKFGTAVLEIALGRNGSFRGRYAGRRSSTVEPVARIDIPGLGALRRQSAARDVEPLHEGRGIDWRLRFSREIGVLGGPARFARFREARFCVVGAGRTGSLVTHDLARREPRGITVIDPDVILPHNTPAMDVAPRTRPGTPKVQAIRSFLKRIGFARLPLGHRATALSPAAFASAAGSDVLVSAVDHNRGRLEVSMLATLFLRPHLDLGTGVLEREGRTQVGFDVRMIVPGDGCLICVGGLPDLARARPGDFREERVGSSRSLNGAAVGHGMRLLERFFAGTLRRTVWQRYEETPTGSDRLTSVNRGGAEDCPLCRMQGLGEGARRQAAGLLSG
jgi:hypothetical protein